MLKRKKKKRRCFHPLHTAHLFLRCFRAVIRAEIEGYSFFLIEALLLIYYYFPMMMASEQKPV